MEFLDPFHISSNIVVQVLVLVAELALIYGVTYCVLRWLNRFAVRKVGEMTAELRKRLRSLSRLIRISVLCIAIIIILDAVLKTLMGDITWAWLGLFKERAIRILTIVILALLGYWFTLVVSAVLPRLASDEDETTITELEQRAQTVSVMLRRAGAMVIGVIAGMMILPQIGLDITPILASAGIVGLAIGFGAQSLVKDIISGFFIILENRLAVGDYVTIGKLAGTVERVALRTTALRDMDGTLHIVPNGDIRTISNRNRVWARSILKIRVPYEANVKEIEAILRDVVTGIGQEEQYADILLDEPIVLPVNELNESWITMMVLLRTKAGQQWAISRDLRERVLQTFREAGIQIRVVGPDLAYELL